MKYITDFFSEDDWIQFQSIFARIIEEADHWVWNGPVNPDNNRAIVNKRPVRKSLGEKHGLVYVHRFLYDTMVLRPKGEALGVREYVLRVCEHERCVNPEHHARKEELASIAQHYLAEKGSMS